MNTSPRLVSGIQTTSHACLDAFPHIELFGTVCAKISHHGLRMSCIENVLVSLVHKIDDKWPKKQEQRLICC